MRKHSLAFFSRCYFNSGNLVSSVISSLHAAVFFSLTRPSYTLSLALAEKYLVIFRVYLPFIVYIKWGRRPGWSELTPCKCLPSIFITVKK